MRTAKMFYRSKLLSAPLIGWKTKGLFLEYEVLLIIYIHWGRPFRKWKIFSADPSYSENCFQLILGHSFPLTQHAFPLTKHTFPLMYIFFCKVLVFNQHFRGLQYKIEGGTEKLGVINLYYG